MDNIDFEKAKSYLMTNHNGRNLYEHLSELIMKIITEKPADALNQFEYLSSLIKQTKFTPPIEEEKMDQEPKCDSKVLLF